MFKKFTAVALVLASLQMGFIQCYGGFRLAKKYDGFVRSIGNKWIRWLLFLFTFWNLGAILFIVDLLIFNSIEFWLGFNPVGLNEYDEKGEYVKTEERGDEKTVFTYKKYGQELHIDVYKKGKLLKSVFLKKDEPEVIYSHEKDGLAVYRMNMRKSGERTHVQLVRNEEVQHGVSMNREEYARLIESKAHLARPAGAAATATF